MGEDMSTFNGIGTKFYGSAQKRPDGSYVTTEWFTVLYFPIIPLRSLRIAETGSKFFTVIVYSSRQKQYVILEEVPLSKNLRQVFLTWAFTLVPLAWLMLAPLRR
jgi:hypothetical protein